MILSILILLFGMFALLQFATFYCRTLLIAYHKVDISERTREFANIPSARLAPEEFPRLMNFVRMAPDPSDDSAEILTVKAYFLVMRFLHFVTAPISKRAAGWIELELSSCAYFAAVTLDRRMPQPAQN